MRAVILRLTASVFAFTCATGIFTVKFFVGENYLLHEVMTHNVLFGKFYKRNVFDVFKNFNRFNKTAFLD